MTAFSALRACGVGLWVTLSASAQTYTLVRSFNTLDGAAPVAGVVESGGVLYGTTTALGLNNGGTVFKVNPDGTGYTVLRSFTTATDGGLPMCDLVVSGGIVYGTTSVGGVNNGGTVFKVNTNGTGFTVLKAFDSSLTVEGNTPAAGLVLSGTNLYGTTQFGGNGGNGTIFQVDTNGSTFSTLHTMLSAASDGAFPQSTLVLSGSTLYGTASGGGPSLFGTVFSMNTDGSGYTVLKYFAGPTTEGRNPVGGLLLSGGVLYGTTAAGGSSDFGTVFKMNTNGSGFSVLKQFAGAPTDGGIPASFLTLSRTTLYGTTAQGGSSGAGTIFKLNTDSSGYGALYTFLGTAAVPPTFPNGAMPNGGLLSYNGAFYGLVNGGGANNLGALYSLTVPNSPPTLGPIAVSGTEDTTLAFTAANFTGAYSDPQSTPLASITIASLPATGTLELSGANVPLNQVISAANLANLAYVPAANENGTKTFTVTASDGSLSSTAATVTMTLAPVNDAPVGVNKTVTTFEDTAYTFAAADFGFSDPNDTPPNTLLAVKITTLPLAGTLADNGTPVSAGAFVPVADINGGKLVFTPVANANGSPYASFTFQVQDNGGTLNGGVDLDPTPRLMTLNVTPVNDAPSGANKTVTTLEDTAYTFTAADFGFSDPNDTPPNTLLAVKITTLPLAGTLADNGTPVSAGAFMPVADINGGKLVFTPVANANGSPYAGFTFQVQDNGGTANGGVDVDPTPRTMTLNVTPVNDAPSGANKTVTTFEDTAYTFAAADFGFSDPNDTPPNTLLAVKITTLPLAGTLADNGTPVSAGAFVPVADLNGGKLVFTPVANANGSPYAGFTFQVQDNGGTANGGVDVDLTPRTITLNVTPVNDAPVGANKTVTTLEDTPYTFATADFGFSDPSDTPANTLQAVKMTSLPAVGTLTDNGTAVTAGAFVPVADLNGGKLVFTPAANANGSPYATFTFQVQDNGGTANGGVDLDPIPRTMTLNVTPVNDPPVVTTTGTTLNYIPHSGAVLLDSAITVTDVDSPMLASAKVSITAGFVTGEDVLALPNPPANFTISVNAGVLTLTGPASPADYQAALRLVTYANTSPKPSTATRTVSFVANDGQADSIAATRNINENPVVIRVSNASVLEGAAGQNTTVQVQVVRVGAVDAPIQIDYTTQDGTATTAHNDYQAQSGTVKFSGNNTGGVLRDFQAFPGLQGGVRVAVGDVNGDGIADIIVGAGPGGQPTVTVYDGATGNQLASFLALPSGFRGGVYVAAGDVNGDGKADIIVGAGPGGGPEVTVYSGADYSVLYNFFAFDQNFSGGVRVAAGDVEGNGKADIIVGAGPGAGPNVKVFRGTDLTLLDSFFAFGSFFIGGVFVAAGDVNGDGHADIIVGADAGGGPEVKVFAWPSHNVLQDFFAYGPSFVGGVRVAAADVNGDGKAEIITAPGAGLSPSAVRVFDGTTAAKLNEFSPFPALSGGLFVAGGALLGPGGDDLVVGADTTTPEVKAFMGGLGEVQTVDLTVIGNNLIEPDKQFKVRLSNIQASGRNVIFAGGQATEAATITILNDDGDNPPVVITTATTLNYTEGSAPVPVDPGITVSDADNTTLASAVVSITGNFQPNEDSLALASLPTGITTSYSAGVLTLRGRASVAAYQTALSSVTYANGSHNPSPLPRTVSFKANDGQKDSNLATKTISITPVNDPPVVATTATAQNYTVASSPVPVDPGISVTDVDNTTLSSATVSITAGFVLGEDVLTLPNSTGIKATYDAGAGVLKLTGSAAVSAYQAALRSVTYVNSSPHPSMLTRTVSFQANDGQADSNTATRDIAFVKASQTITWSTPSTVTFDQSPITLNATASSGLPVTFSMLSGPATIDPNHNNQVILQGIGTVRVQASQAGDADYNPAPITEQELTVSKGNQTITFNSVANKLMSDPPFALNATASSGLDVTYTLVSGPIALDGANVTLNGPGLVTVTASQSGEPNYNPAASVTRSFFVSRFTKLVDFTGTTGLAIGAYPFGNLVQAVDGNFYVTTFGGGAHNFGTVLRITPAGVVLQRADFSGTANGAYPGASVEPDTQGNYWGLTAFGGANDQGVVFKLTPDGVLTKVHDFNTADGAYPWGGLTRGADGNFYGMTSAGGDNGRGTAFKLTPDGAFRKLLDFDGANHGAAPLGNLAPASPDFVGATSEGGANNDGVLFFMDASGALTRLLDFDGAGHGAAPGGDILVDPSSASVYVLTTKGGAHDLGAIVAYSPFLRSANKLADFDGAGLGAHPFGVLALANDHAFYGLAHEGGANNLGTIFRMTNSGSAASLTTLASFPPGDPGNGANPFDSLVQAADGAFYGTTSAGGANNLGTIFKLEVGLPIRNHAPTDIALSASSVAENQAPAARVGALSASDPDAGQTFTYSLVPGVPDNAAFSIANNNTLLLNITAQFATKNSYTITVRATDSGTPALAFDKQLTITVIPVNHAPAGADNTVTLLEDTSYIFTTADFGFSDPNDSPANALSAVKITTLPAAGALTNNGVAVSAGASVSVADITAGKLIFMPATNANGSAYATFKFQVQDNGGTANGGVDVDPTPRTMTLAVTPVNDAPSFSLPTFPPVVAWGDNKYGQTNVPAGLSGVTAIAAGYYHTVALKNDGTVVAWGYNGLSQTNVPAGLSGVTAIAAGGFHTVALTQDGTVVAWGFNSNGQTNVPAGLGGVTAIAAGRYHTVALKNDGTIVAWGRNDFGEINVPAGLSGVVAIAAGQYHTVALKNDGTVVAWGDNHNGQTSVPAGLSGVTAIAAGGVHTVALKNDGTVVAWGYNAQGQTNVPGGLSGVTAIAAGVDDTVALKNDGTVVAWGDNFYGETNVPAGLSGVTAIAAGASHTVALTDGGAIKVAAGSGPFTRVHYATSISAGPPDESGQMLTFQVSNDNTSLFSVQPAIDRNVTDIAVNHTGTLTFTPASGAIGTANVTVTLQDNGGIVNGGVDTSAPQTFTVNVIVPNHPPSFTLKQSWTPRTSAPATNWSSVASSADGTKLVATVYGGQIYTSTDSGVTWNAQSVADDPHNWISVASSADGAKLVAVVSGGQIYTSTDSGKTWTPQSNAGSRQWGSVASSADGTKLVAAVGGISSSGGNIYTSADSGATWTRQNNAPAASWSSVASSADGAKLVASVSGGQIYTSPDYGNTWTPQLGAGSRHWSSVASSTDGTKVVAAVGGFFSSGGNLYTSTDSGTTWTRQDSAPTTNWFSVASSADGTKLVALNIGGQIYTSSNSGRSWMAQPGVPSTYWFSVATSADGAKLVAVPYGGRIYTADLNADPVGLASAGAQSIPNYASNISAGPANEAGQTVTFQVSNDHPNLFSVQPAIATDGTLTYTPAVGANGTATVTVTLKDNGGTAAGGVDTSPSQTFTITVVTANKPPTLDSINDFTIVTPPDVPPQTVNLTGISAGPGESQALTITATSDNHGLVPDPTVKYTSPDATGTLTFTPVAGQGGSANITVTVKDNGGTENGGVDTVTRTFSVTVIIPNHAPSFTIGHSWTAHLTDLARNWSSVASSADGTKLAAVDGSELSTSDGQIYTSTDSGMTWKAQTGAGTHRWSSVASSADGTKLVAVEVGTSSFGQLYTSTDAGITWTAQTGAGTRNWSSVASSADGSKLVSVDVFNGALVTSTDSGATWTARTVAARSLLRSVASSADGTKLVVVTGQLSGFATSILGLIYTSTDSGMTWTTQSSAGNHDWQSVASSADGTKLVAVEYTPGSSLSGIGQRPGSIYTSTDSGVHWTLQSGAGYRLWNSVASSADGTRLVAGAVGDAGGIYTSPDSGVSWHLESTASGNHAWQSVASSADGTRLVAVDIGGAIWTADLSQVLTVADSAGPQTTASFAQNISAGSPGEATQKLTFQVSNDNPNLFTAQPAIDPGVTDRAANHRGTLSFTPKVGASGTATVTVTLKDNGGTANNGSDTSAAQTFTITVFPSVTVSSSDSTSRTLNGQTLINTSGNPITLSGATTLSGSTAIRGNVTLSGSVTVSSGATLNVSDTVTINGTLQSNPTGGTFVKTGPGKLVIKAQQLNGSLVVLEGTVEVEGLNPFICLILGGSSVLQGNGTANCVFSKPGSTLRPGASPGAIATTADFSWAAGATYECEINNATGSAGANPGWDFLNIGGALNISATTDRPFNLVLKTLTLTNAPGDMVNFDDRLPYSWKIASAAGGITGFTNTVFNLDTSGFLNTTDGGTLTLEQPNATDLVLVYRPFAPALSVQPAGADTILAWPFQNTAGFQLEQTTNLADPASWLPSSGIFNTDFATNTVTVPAPGNTLFFRLRKP